ncbi:hypothetical protein CTAYLR_005019 [Chrysophaeum taylorii]|uniref:PPIase cyclophilin-type domain-containing protein n=1 Tax=Chrysophaeum taylorii TaxID=2483200 RepID=A0AAD7UAN8_9STRA|nr:hypothetical protein CTAYLR_005019 [Chrysophaeum taylorii]
MRRGRVVEASRGKAERNCDEAVDETPASRSFFRALGVHTCFSLVLVALVVAGLRFEKGRRPTPTNTDAPVTRLRRPPEDLDALVARHRRTVSEMRRSGVVMETDPVALAATSELRNATKRLLETRYGKGPTYRLAIRLAFPASMGGGPATLVIETAPIDVVPHAIHVFLDACVAMRLRPEEQWTAAFHRNAGHVLQAFVRTPEVKGLAYQEYDPAFPHEKYTLGFAGRPGGPEFYISTLDNTRNHGPGSQGSKTEADSCFAKIVEGFDVVERMRRQPAPPGLGFVHDSKEYINILGVDILNYDPA